MPTQRTAQDDDMLDFARRVVETEIDGLRRLSEGLDASFVTAVNILRACTGHVIVTGMGKSGHIGRKIAATMASTGTPAYFVHPADASHGDLGMVVHKDVLLAISNSGQSRELSDILLHAQRLEIPVIAITQDPDSPLGRIATVVLRLPKMREACPLERAPTTSTTVTLALGDALAMCLMRERGFREADFASLHPGGRLGAVLLSAGELVRTQERSALPLVPPEADMRRVILTMTKGRMGHAGVTDAEGRLVGIISDGDLRRAFEAGRMEENAAAIMTENPKTVPAGMRAHAVRELMQRHKISAVFVTTEDGKPLGLLHLQELLRL